MKKYLIFTLISILLLSVTLSCKKDEDKSTLQSSTTSTNNNYDVGKYPNGTSNIIFSVGGYGQNSVSFFTELYSSNDTTFNINEVEGYIFERKLPIGSQVTIISKNGYFLGGLSVYTNIIAYFKILDEDLVHYNYIPLNDVNYYQNYGGNRVDTFKFSVPKYVENN